MGPLTRRQATTYLETLVGDMFGGAHNYLLPVEAVLDWADPDNDRSLDERVEHYRDRAWNSPSSKYGPIYNWSAFEPPDDAEALAKRRFGLFFDLIGEGGDA
jgi:hypothetical protein